MMKSGTMHKKKFSFQTNTQENRGDNYLLYLVFLESRYEITEKERNVNSEVENFMSNQSAPSDQSLSRESINDELPNLF
jgi:hypothetical protein